MVLATSRIRGSPATTAPSRRIVASCPATRDSAARRTLSPNRMALGKAIGASSSITGPAVRAGCNPTARCAGGVCYMDLNGNRFYDVGEGLGSMTISSSDGATVSTWKSGAFTLELKGQKEITLTAVYEGEKFSKTFSAGSENIKFDWIVAPQVA